MKWMGKVLLIYIPTAYLSLILTEAGFSLGLYPLWLSGGQSVFSYSWFIPTAVVSFYICANRGVSTKTFSSVVLIIAFLYISQFLLDLYLKPAFITYAEFYDAAWKYTRDKIVINYKDIPIHPWLFGALFGYLLGFMKEYLKNKKRGSVNRL